MALGLTIYGIAVATVVRRWDLPSVGLGAVFLIVLALVLEIVSKSLFGLLFRVGLAHQGHIVSRRLSIGAAFVGTAVARLLPGGTALSPSAMAWSVRAEDDGAAGAALRATLTSYGGLLVIGGLALGWTASVGDQNLFVGSGVAAAAVISTVGVLILVGSSWLGVVVRVLPARLQQHFGITANGGRLTLPEIGLIFLRLVLEATVFWLTLAAFGIELSVSETVLAFGAGKVIGSVPITPGGIGMVEGGMFGALATIGYASEDALASILVYQLLDYWMMAGVGLFIAGRLSASSPVGADSLG